MNFIDKIKKFFEPREAPYNWGASIDHLRKKIESHLEHHRSHDTQIDMNFLLLQGDFIKMQEKIDHQAAFFSDQMHAYEESYRAAMFILQEKISKLDSEIKKLKKKPKIKK